MGRIIEYLYNKRLEKAYKKLTGHGIHEQGEGGVKIVKAPVGHEKPTGGGRSMTKVTLTAAHPGDWDILLEEEMFLDE